MRVLVGMLVVCAVGLLGQTAPTAETYHFLVSLASGNEVPPPADLNASGYGFLLVHVVRDAAGKITSGAVDFNVRHTFPGAITITGMHVHAGAAGVSGLVRINSGISPAAPVRDDTGRGGIERQGEVAAGDAQGLDTLAGLLENPAGYYVNLHTTTHPNGAIRGQLLKTETRYLMGLLSSDNEVPPASQKASGVASVMALRGFDSAGAFVMGMAFFDLDYGFPGPVTFTGMHVHTGAAGVNGPVTLNSGLTTVESAPAGKGHVQGQTLVLPGAQASVSALHGLFSNPAGYYANLHTSVNPGGAVRAQLHNTALMVLPVRMTPAKMMPAVTGLDADGVGTLRLRTLLNADGSVVAARIAFDVNPRFPSRQEFTGLHLHIGGAAENGPAIIESGISRDSTVVSETGAANLYREANVSSAEALAAVNSLLEHPDRYYLELHTTGHPNGAMRAQMREAPSAGARVTYVMCAISDPNRTTVAPGGLMTIFGSDLVKVAGGLDGLTGDVVPARLNGTEVSIGGQKAPVLVVTPSYVVAQAPVELSPGRHPVVVRTPDGASAPFSATVAARAPGIFFDGVGGIVLNNASFRLIRPDYPARAGDILLVYSTGLGQTSPPLATGKLAGFPPPADTAPVTVALGGSTAEALYSIAAPGYAGLYQTAIRVPTGLTPGNAELVIRVGEAASNPVNIAVQ